MKAILENARAHQYHQNLIIGNPRAFIHRVQAVQQVDDLVLVKERNRR